MTAITRKMADFIRAIARAATAPPGDERVRDG